MLIQSPIRAVLHQDCRQNGFDERQTSNPACVARIGRNFEGKRAAVGMADDVQGTAVFGEPRAQCINLFQQSSWQDERLCIDAITGDVGRDDLACASKLPSKPIPLAARAERTMESDDGTGSVW